MNAWTKAVKFDFKFFIHLVVLANFVNFLTEGRATRLFCLLQDFSGSDQKWVLIFYDNEGTVRLAYNPEFHQMTKHIFVRYHYIRQQFAEGKIEVQYVSRKDKLADLFTKALAVPKFIKMRNRIGV